MFDFFLIDTAFAAGSITNAPQVADILLNILYFLLSIVGIVAIIGLVVAGGFYLTAGGNEQRITLAKRASLASVIGVIVALGALVIVSQLTKFFLMPL